MAEEFETDPDLELDLDPAFHSDHAIQQQQSFGESLGGMGLGDELDLHQGQGQGEGQRPTSNSTSRNPTTSSPSSSLFPPDSRQNAGETLGGSLADELASATTISPSAQRKEERRRMREEYGLEIEEDDEEEEEEQDQQDQEDEQEEQQLQQSSSSRRRRGKDQISTTPTQSQLPIRSNKDHNLDPKRIPKSSDSSSVSSTTREESQAFKDERLASENESIYNQNTSSLIDSMRCSDSFLKKLRELDGKTVKSHGSGNPTSGGGEMEYDSFKLETVSKEMIRNLQDHLLRRESQLREWREIEMNFNRIEGENGGGLAGLRAAGGLINAGIGNNSFIRGGEDQDQEEGKLGSLQETEEEEERENQIHEQEDDDDEEEDEETTSNRRSKNRRRGGRGGGSSLSRNPNQTLQNSTTANNNSSYLDLPPLPSSQEAASNQLNHLILLNSSLISSLNHLHDQVQVQRAGMSEVGKRLRNLKSVFGQWKLEWEGVERSRKWIEIWEGQNQTQTQLSSQQGSRSISSSSTLSSASHSNNKENQAVNFEELGFVRKPENIKDWTDQQLQRFEKILNDAEINARKLLDPIQTPEIEKLIEEGRKVIEKDDKLKSDPVAV